MQEKKLGILTSTVEMEKKSEHHTAGYHLETNPLLLQAVH